MKMLLLASVLILPACAAAREDAGPPDLVLPYRDLALDTPAGRAELTRRVRRAAADFCASYDPQNDEAIFDPWFASPRHCPGAAAIRLAQHMPAAIRQAYHAGKRGE